MLRPISPWILVCTWGLTTAVACGRDERRDDGPNDPRAGSGGQASGGTSQRGGSAGESGSGGVHTSGSNAGGDSGSSGSNAGGDSGASSNAGGDSGSSGSNAGGDSGASGESGDGPEWEGCPTADDYGVEAGPHAVNVTDDATYCATFDENRTLKQELAAKALLRITPGRYALPGADRDDLGLPSCLRFGATSRAIPVTGGQATYTADPFDGQVIHRYQFTQTLVADGNARRLRTEFLDRTPATETPAFVLDGTEVDFAAQDFIRYLTLCPADGDCAADTFFDSCEHRSARLHSHALTLGSGAGTVTFELRISESFSSTEPGAFVRASGTFRGTPFEQRDYWKLVYNPAHHHFVRNFAVLFDEPIDGVCGIQVMGLEPLDDALTPDVAATVDCELNETGPLTVESHQHTVGPLP
jgi:hypothetical protein